MDRIYMVLYIFNKLFSNVFNYKRQLGYILKQVAKNSIKRVYFINKSIEILCSYIYLNFKTSDLLHRKIWYRVQNKPHAKQKSALYGPYYRRTTGT